MDYGCLLQIWHVMSCDQFLFERLTLVANASRQHLQIKNFNFVGMLRSQIARQSFLVRLVEAAC